MQLLQPPSAIRQTLLSIAAKHALTLKCSLDAAMQSVQLRCCHAACAGARGSSLTFRCRPLGTAAAEQALLVEDGHQGPGCCHLLQAAGVDEGVQEGCAVLAHTVVGQATYRQPLQRPERLQCTRCDIAELRFECQGAAALGTGSGMRP